MNTTLIAIVGERAKEFALQKALGAKQSDIIKQISTEILIIALCAIVAGLILGYILAQLLGLTVFNLILICVCRLSQLLSYYRYWLPLLR